MESLPVTLTKQQELKLSANCVTFPSSLSLSLSKREVILFLSCAFKERQRKRERKREIIRIILSLPLRSLKSVGGKTWKWEELKVSQEPSLEERAPTQVSSITYQLLLRRVYVHFFTFKKKTLKKTAVSVSP